MNALKIVVPALFAALMLNANPADACSALRSCVPGPSVGAAPYITVGRSAGSLLLQGLPAHAEVYVDGVYAGRADRFDGTSGASSLIVGRHRIEVRAEGYAPLKFRAHIQKARTSVHLGTLVELDAAGRQ